MLIFSNKVLIMNFGRKHGAKINHPSQLKLVALMILPILFIGFISTYVTFNYFDWKNAYLNPPDPLRQLNQVLYYPQSNGAVNLSSVFAYVQLFINYSGSIIEGQSVVTIEAIGYGMLSSNVAYITVGYNGALASQSVMPTVMPFGDMNLFYNFSNLASLPPSFFDNPTHTFLAYTGNITTFVFPIEGYYYPSVIVHFLNLTETPSLDYPQYSLHANSIDVLIQERYAKMNAVLSFALFAFAIVGSAEIIVQIWNWYENSKLWQRKHPLDREPAQSLWYRTRRLSNVPYRKRKSKKP